MARMQPRRQAPPGQVPLVNVEGTAADCGRMLGYIWAEQLRRGAAQVSQDSRPWWQDKRFAKLVDRYVPHLPEVFRRMAQSAGLPDHLVGTRAPASDAGGCTSFALAPSATLDRRPLSGQTKDTPEHRLYQFQVLRMKASDAPSLLTLTYEGWLFGHGFAEGGCAIFRNSLYAGSDPRGTLPYAVWGVLAQHCRSVEEVVELTRRHGIGQGFHATVADAAGGIVGIESTMGGCAFLNPRRGMYVHANAVVGNKRLIRLEQEDKRFTRADSLHRQTRLRELLEVDHGRLTAQLAMAAMSDHDGYPVAICRHESTQAMTCAAVVVEPGLGLLHVTRGAPCQNWPATYRL